MGKLLDKIAKLQALNVEQVAETSLSAISSDLVDAQKDQLEKGQDSEGDKIRWQKDSHYPYTKPYERRKSKLGLQTEVVDLKLSGDYYNELQARVESGKVVIKSMNDKAVYLEENYNKDLINGLNPEHKVVIINEKLRPVFLRNIKEQLKTNP